MTKTAHKSVNLDLDNIRLYAGEAHRFVREALPQGSLHRVPMCFLAIHGLNQSIAAGVL